MIVGNLEIQLRADIARLQRDMDQARSVVNSTASGIGQAADQMKAALAGIGLGAGLAQLIQMSDQYTKFTAQLKLATGSQQEYALALAEVKRISTDAQSGMAGTGTLYARIANGTRELGVSQKQVAEITETVSLALKVSGATAEESASAQLQLSQAFASGALRGEEFNAVNEAAPRLMKALADGMGMPIGALKEMASNGEITSKIMADVLPGALEKLRDESKQIQTISGAFQVLKDRVMEYTAVHAEANGSVAVLTTGIGLLANNFASLMGIVTTLTAAKLGASLEVWVTKTYQQVTAAAALRAANIALLESELASSAAKVTQLTATEAAIVAERQLVVARLAEARANIASAEAAISAASAAGAQSFALRTLRLATAELAVAETQRATMMAELAILGRQQTSVSAQLAAARTAEAAAQLGLNAATSAGAAAAGLASRALGFLGGPVGALITVLGLAAVAWSHWGSSAKDASDQAKGATEDGFASIIESLDAQIEKNEALIRLRKQGMSLDAAQKVDQKPLNEISALSAQLAALNAGTGQASGASREDLLFKRQEILQKIVELTTKLNKNEATGAEATALTQAEARAKFMGEYATKAEQLAAKLAEARKLLGSAFTADDEARIRKAYAVTDQAAKQEQTAYQNLMTSIQEKIAANRLEMSGYNQLSDSQKLTIALDAEISTGKTKLSAADIERARAQIAVVAAMEAVIASNKRAAAGAEEYTKMVKAHDDQVAKSILAANEEASKNEELVTTFGMTKAAIEALELARLQDQLVQKSSLGLTLDEIETLEKLIDAKTRNVAAVSSVEALEAQKRANEEMVAEYKKAVDKYDDVFRTGFADMLNHGKSGWKSFTTSLITTFKTTVADQIYKMLAQPFVVRMVGSLLGVTGTSAATAATSSAGGSAAGSLLGSALGSASAIGTGAMQTAGAVLSGQIGLFDTMAAGWTAATSGTMAGFTAGMSSLLGTLGPIALGIGAVVALAKKWDDSGTIHTGGAASASATGVSNIDARPLGFQNINTADTTNQLTSQLASSIVAILDSTATTFGKTAGYTAATAFADDTSKDGAWGALIISNLNGLVSQWGDANSRWAPEVFADGEAGQKEYLAQISTSVRSALDGIGLPTWAKSMLDALGNSPALEDLAKVVDSINLTQRALTLMGQRLTGFAGLSDAAVSSLIKASGGIESLATNASAFYDSFYSEGEKTKVVTDQVAAALKAVGVQMPETREAYRAEVEAQLALGAAGGPAAAALLANAQAFASVVPVVEAATNAVRTQQQIANEHADLQGKLDELTLPQEQLAAKARAAIDAHNLALYDQVVAAQAAKDALAEVNIILDLQGQIAAVTGDKAAAAAVLQEQHKAALVGLTPAVAAATQALWDAQAAEQAKKEALDRQNALLSNQAQIYELTGDKAGAAAVLEKQHAAALALLDPELRGATQALWDAQKAAAASKDALAAVSDAYMAVSTVIDREKKYLNDTYTVASEAMQAGIDSGTEAVTKLTSLSEALKSTLDAMKIPGLEREERAAAQAQIEAALAIAKAGGPLPDADSLKSALSTVSKDASSQFSTQLDYVRDLYRTKNAISALGSLTDTKLSAEQQMLDTLKEQKKALDTAHKAEIALLDNQLDQLKTQTDLLNGIATSLMTLPDALKVLAAAMGAATKDPTVGTDALTSLYKTLLGRAPDAGGLAYWQQVLAGGASLSDVAAGIKNDYEYKGLHSTPAFAGGGDHLGGLRLVGEDGPELEATGPSRIFNANQTRSMLSGGDSAVVAELRELRKQIARLEASSERTATGGEKVAKIVQRVGGQGDYFVVKAAEEETA